MILDVADGRIQGVSAIVNPDKLRHLGPVADLVGLLREGSRSPPGRGAGPGAADAHPMCPMAGRAAVGDARSNAGASNAP